MALLIQIDISTLNQMLSISYTAKDLNDGSILLRFDL